MSSYIQSCELIHGLNLAVCRHYHVLLNSRVRNAEIHLFLTLICDSYARECEISISAAGTMMHSAFYGQIIILIVFAPILFLTGVSGKMFQPMAFTFSFALISCLMISGFLPRR